MKLLLDTHVFLWTLLQPEKLPKKIVSCVEDPSNEIWLSPITTWECLLLGNKGRIRLRPDPIHWMREQLKQLQPREAPLNHEVVFESRLLDIEHDDPADRFLAATAIVFDLTLVTADDRLLQSKRLKVLSAI